MSTVFGFLTIHAQRKCLTMIANSCSNISPLEISQVKEAFMVLLSSRKKS